MDAALRNAILARDDASAIEKIYAAQESFRPMRRSAGDLVRAGLTDDAEVLRVLGQARDSKPDSAGSG